MNTPDIKDMGLAGYVLAASPSLTDENFSHSLVLMVEHDRLGAVGLVMNRPVGRALHEVTTGPFVDGVKGTIPVLFGGPVQSGHVLIALFEGQEDDSRIRCTLGITPELAQAHLDGGPGWVRAFVGYAGWGAGQLDRELGEGAWKVCTPHPVIFRHHFAGTLWSAFAGEDQRWRRFVDRLPEHGWN
ncbi:MAG TPA: YqgE/AlgH family protein [Kiritimatiellia bacterium]|nr:YqgE/AlgH family protein [Kiritimatiellia bacterium]